MSPKRRKVYVPDVEIPQAPEKELDGDVGEGRNLMGGANMALAPSSSCAVMSGYRRRIAVELAVAVHCSSIIFKMLLHLSSSGNGNCLIASSAVLVDCFSAVKDLPPASRE